jgi:hypothetical protein
MMNLKSMLTVLVTLCLMSLGCKQITKSVDETFHPKAAPIKTEKQVTKSSYDTAVIQQMQQVEQQLTTVISTHSETYTTKEGKQIINRAQALIKTAISNASQNSTKKKPSLWTAEKLQKAEMDLRALPQYAGKEIFIYQSAHFYEDGQIKLMLRHPDNPRYVDNYEYSEGKWSGPKPEALSVHADIAGRSISLNNATFAGAAKVIQLYNEKAAQVEGAKPTDYAYISIWDKGMRWFPSTINGSRERYTIQFNNDGTLKSFVQD